AHIGPVVRVHAFRHRSPPSARAQTTSCPWTVIPRAPSGAHRSPIRTPVCTPPGVVVVVGGGWVVGDGESVVLLPPPPAGDDGGGVVAAVGPRPVARPPAGRVPHRSGSAPAG